MTDIILTTLNARYIHSSLGLRYLFANMGDLKTQTQIMEFVIDKRPIDIVETLLIQKPKIIGISVYIWNIEQTTQVVAMLKQVRPDIVIVLGGPEVSYEYNEQKITSLADYVITGTADITFGKLCQNILSSNQPLTKIINPDNFSLSELAYPYPYYSDDDIKNRILYIEASRGCPFKCEFCLSALDKTAWPFNIDSVLQEIDTLYNRGARNFKFVDRTFNLKIDSSIKIMQYFLDRLDDDLFLHFEVIPDHLPERLKQVIQQFPDGSLQFEVGIQTFNQTVQQLISRKQNNEKSKQNLIWLRQHSKAHLHTDLIIGLPGEDMASFEKGFNQLYALQPHEIQVGILKRLRGSPLIRHTDEYQLVFNPNPPYNILSTSLIDFLTMQRLNRFARYWDMIANSGRFKHTLALALQENPFQQFLELSDWLFEQTQQTHKIALGRLFELLYQSLYEKLNIEKNRAQKCLRQDYQQTKLKGYPSFMPPQLQARQLPKKQDLAATNNDSINNNRAAKRQSRHLL